MDKVSDSGGTKTGQKSLGTLSGNDLLESTDQTSVEGHRIQLNSGLDHINWAQSTVSHGAANGTGQCTLEVVVQVVHFLAMGSGSGYNFSVSGTGLNLLQKEVSGDRQRFKAVHLES